MGRLEFYRTNKFPNRMQSTQFCLSDVFIITEKSFFGALVLRANKR